MYRSHVLVCGGTGCTSSGSERIVSALEREIQDNGLSEEVKVIKTGCFGLCALGPIMIVYPEGAFYSMVKPEDIPEIVSEHLLKGRIVTRLLYQETVPGRHGKIFEPHPVLRQAKTCSAEKLRRNRPGKHQRIHRPGRLHGSG